MRHHRYNPEFRFVREPVDFNKRTERGLLQYCLGATLYMPGTKNITETIVKKKRPGLTSMVMCFEDAISEDQLPEAERNVIDFLNSMVKSATSGEISQDDLPLFFLRVRSSEQFRDFTDRLTPEQISALTGFVFPKFSTKNGCHYLNILKELNTRCNDTIYGMPILESAEIAYKETRMYELIGIKNMLKPYKEFVLNVRVGGTDFSSRFGVRRGIDYSIYDIVTVRDCLSDILNFLGREDDDYVISAPVWEYFLVSKSSKFDESREATIHSSIHTSLLKRNRVVNEAIDGLLREVVLDKANGFVGKTIIHPSHLKYVNALQAVTREEYEDAVQIMETSGGVVKSTRANKMNEINPHRSWAKKILSRAAAYGVVENDSSYFELFLET